MKLYSVYDPEFRHYGQIVEGMEDSIQEILAVLKQTPVPQSPAYVAEEPALQALQAMEEISQRLYGGMPVQLLLSTIPPFAVCNPHDNKASRREIDGRFAFKGHPQIPSAFQQSHGDRRH